MTLLKELSNLANINESFGTFGGFQDFSRDAELEQMNMEVPAAGPALISQYRGDKEIILVLGVDPDEERIRVAIENPNRGSSHIKYFDDTESGYAAAKEYAKQLRTVKVNNS